MAQYARDTIVAAATPPGKGGIGIVRISGDDTEKLAAAMLGNVPQPRVATRAKIHDKNGDELDHGIALYFLVLLHIPANPYLNSTGMAGRWLLHLS